jgi:hypothetical protein
LGQITVREHPYWINDGKGPKRGHWNEPEIRARFIERAQGMKEVPDGFWTRFATELNISKDTIRGMAKNHKWLERVRELRISRIEDAQATLEERLVDQKNRILDIADDVLRGLSRHARKTKLKVGELERITRAMERVHGMDRLELREPTTILHSKEVKISLVEVSTPHAESWAATRVKDRVAEVAKDGDFRPIEVQGSGRGEEDRKDRPDDEVPVDRAVDQPPELGGVVHQPIPETGEGTRVEGTQEAAGLPERLPSGGSPERERPDDTPDRGEAPLPSRD